MEICFPKTKNYQTFILKITTTNYLCTQLQVNINDIILYTRLFIYKTFYHPEYKFVYFEEDTTYPLSSSMTQLHLVTSVKEIVFVQWKPVHINNHNIVLLISCNHSNSTWILWALQSIFYHNPYNSNIFYSLQFTCRQLLSNQELSFGAEDTTMKSYYVV